MRKIIRKTKNKTNEESGYESDSESGSEPASDSESDLNSEMDSDSESSLSHKDIKKNDRIKRSFWRNKNEDGSDSESDSESVLDRVSIQEKIVNFSRSCFPSKEQANDRLLQNRMKVCALAIVLMWTSSLRTATYISSFVIETPPFETVFSSCQSAATVSMDERKKFSSCVDIQGEQCNRDVDEAISQEMTRVDELAAYNDDVLRRVEDSLGTCIADYTSLKRGLEGWVSELQVIPIKNDTCTNEEREGMMSTVGDINVLKAEALAVSVQYKRESRGTARNIVEYAKIRGEYDRAYMRRHADVVKNTVKDFIQDKYIPTFPPIKAELRVIEDAFHLMWRCLIPNRRLCFENFDYNLGEWVGEMDGMTRFAKQFYIAYRELFRDVTDDYIRQYDKLADKIREFRARTTDAFKKTKEFYDGWHAYLEKAKKNVGFKILYDMLNLFVGWFKEFMSLDLLQMNPLEIYVPGLPYFKIFYDRFDDIIGIGSNAFFDKLLLSGQELHELQRSIVYGAIDEIYKARDNLVGEVNGFRREMMEKVVLPADYKPPRYIGISGSVSSLEDEEGRYSNISEAFLESSVEAIDSVEEAKIKEDEPNITLARRVNFTAVKTKFSNFNINFERLRPPNIEFELWFLQIASIGDLAFLIDHMFRIYFTIRLCFKYWDAGYIKLPQIDIRTQKEKNNPFKFSNGRLFIYLITNPLVGALLAGCALAWAVVLVTSAYLPLFATYRSECIPRGGGGTFITENLFSSAYNFAYNDGSSSLVKEMEYLDVKKSNTCSVRYTATATKQNDNVIEFVTNTDSIQTVATQMNLFGQCIDTEIADAQFQVACCNQTGYKVCQNEESFAFSCPLDTVPLVPIPFSPPGEYLSRQSCRSNFNSTEWQLENAIFDCSTLPACDITCRNPHKEKLRKVTKECGCIVEWFFHSLWLRLILSLLIFVVMNISRVMFVDGLARVIWRRLHPATFTVLVTCDSDGEIITREQYDANDVNEVDDQHCSSKCRDQNEVSRTSESLAVSKLIVAKIDRSTNAFYVGGILKMIASVTLNILWVILLVIVPDTIRIKWLMA